MKFTLRKTDGSKTGASETEPSTTGLAKPAAPRAVPEGEVEYGGPAGPEPTRFGDWEKNGRCSDF